MILCDPYPCFNFLIDEDPFAAVLQAAVFFDDLSTFFIGPGGVPDGFYTEGS